MILCSRLVYYKYESAQREEGRGSGRFGNVERPILDFVGVKTSSSSMLVPKEV